MMELQELVYLTLKTTSELTGAEGAAVMILVVGVILFFGLIYLSIWGDSGN